MEKSPLLLRRATERDEAIIVGLIDEAANWLRTKGTDQWDRPWPNEQERRARILRSIRRGTTWILWEGRLPIATLTAEPDNNQYDLPIWPEEMQHDPAVYVCRLVVSRSHSGQSLGARLLDWAGLSAKQGRNALWIRVDVWTTNEALHAYYEALGFDFWGYADKADGYPSAALFQKQTDQIPEPDTPLFLEASGGC
jgi:GNAT superfamily N-acetyltransferase